jgi:hypothetical protein
MRNLPSLPEEEKNCLFDLLKEEGETLDLKG